MAHLARAVSNTHTYLGDSEINFFSDEQGLSVTIDTERLHIRSVQAEADCDRYAGLFCDQKVMEKFGNGQTKTEDKIRTMVNDLWAERWRTGDPYAGLAVFEKDSNEFLGHVVLGHSNVAGQSTLAYLFNQPHWGKGFGSEAVAAVVKEYAPATVKEGYLLDGRPLETIVATARPDNPASGRILEKVGMQFVQAEEKYGGMRHHYSINLNAIQTES